MEDVTYLVHCQDGSLRRKMNKFETTCIHLEKESKSMA